MEPTTNIPLLSLEPYRRLFPKVTGIDHTVKKGASVSDTVRFIPAIVQRDSWQVKRYVDQELRGLSTYEACKKLWHFVKHHVKYTPDERGSEQVRSGRRLIHDGKGDCDCFTTFIDKCLYRLKIPFINRITKYRENYFQHIYPIVPIGRGKYITMDCVVDKFNYEKPFSEKEDYPMDLQYLDGIDTEPQPLIGIDAQDLLGNQNELDELGKLFHRTPEQKARARQRRRNFGKKLLKVVNVINKINPATVILRAGILISMKTNLMKVAETLRWAYATPQFAASKGMDMNKYAKLKKILGKIEKVFYGAGGKPENLKKSILTGRGNRHHEVAGLGDINQYTLRQLLGSIFDDEFVDGMKGSQGLGELGFVTATAVAAASTAIATIAALIKSVGSLFPKKKSSSSSDSAADASDDNGNDNSSADDNSGAESQQIPDDQTDPPSDPGNEPDQGANDGSTDVSSDDSSMDSDGSDPGDGSNLPEGADDNTELAPSGEDGNSGENTSSTEDGVNGVLTGPISSIKTFYQEHKSWLVPVGVAAAVLTTALIIHHFSKKSSEPEKLSHNHNAVNGPESKSRKKKRGKRHRKQSVISLM